MMRGIAWHPGFTVASAENRFEALWSGTDPRIIGAGPRASSHKPADVQHGATIARRWCSSCHVVIVVHIAKDGH
jgi:hypothetical protein